MYLLIDYDVVRSHRKSLGITVERDGNIVVNAPEALDEKEIEKQVWKKRLWIWEKLAIKKVYQQDAVSKRFVSGESFMYLGRNYRLEVISDDMPLKLQHGWFRFGQKQQRKAKECFKQWYVQHLNVKIKERLTLMLEKRKQEIPVFRVLELGYRWGSCTKEGCLNFNWKIAMAPVGVIDYIIVHELAHMKEATHSEKFWREVQRLMPNYLEKKEWLKKHGNELDVS